MTALRRRGFATLTATILLALVGMAMAAWAYSLRLNLERTQDAAAQAQLRHLLAAGAVHAVADPPDQPGQRVVVSTPGELDAELMVTAERVLVDRKVLLIRSRFEDRVGEQRLTIERDGARWVVSEAELLPYRVGE
ncbi:MAG: hypothetical protein AAF823_00505 [Planctomycetota bacterium]